MNAKGAVGHVLSYRLSGKYAQGCADMSSLQRQKMEEEMEKLFFFNPSVS